jgi:hypothetical protein
MIFEDLLSESLFEAVQARDGKQIAADTVIVGSADHTRNSALLTITASPLMATLLSSVATETKTCGAYERRWRTISYDYSISHHTHPISRRTWPFRRGWSCNPTKLRL